MYLKRYVPCTLCVFLCFTLALPAWGMNRTEMGDELQIMSDLALIWAVVYEKDLEGAAQMLMAHTATRHTVYALKRLTKRKRPNWQPGATRDAFPSSHTAHVFSAAAFIHRRYGLEQAFIPYAIASFTAYTRVHSKMHSWRDVAGGIVIPSIYHFIFTKKYIPEAPSPKKGGGRQEETMELFPHIPPDGGFGLGFKISF